MKTGSVNFRRTRHKSVITATSLEQAVAISIYYYKAQSIPQSTCSTNAESLCRKQFEFSCSCCSRRSNIVGFIVPLPVSVERLIYTLKHAIRLSLALLVGLYNSNSEVDHTFNYFDGL